MHMLPSEILASSNVNMNQNFVPWRTTIHSNVASEIFQHDHIYQGCWKNARLTFQRIIVRQFRGQCPKKQENYGTNLSPTFYKNQDLVPWIGEQPNIKMLVLHFPNNPDICGHVGKFPEPHFNVWLFSNPGDKILIDVEIL